jgi:uncharacterized membrane protein
VHHPPVNAEELVARVAGSLALAIEAAAILVVFIGAVQAFAGVVRLVVSGGTHGSRKAVWRQFGVWLLLGLEFELAADIVRSVISPTLQDIGELAAIAVVRTFLNYFLEKDLDHAEADERKAAVQNG